MKIWSDDENKKMKDCRGKQKATRKEKRLEMQTNARSTITSICQADFY